MFGKHLVSIFFSASEIIEKAVFKIKMLFSHRRGKDMGTLLNNLHLLTYGTWIFILHTKASHRTFLS
jgi:hypothetical protein